MWFGRIRATINFGVHHVSLRPVPECVFYVPRILMWYAPHALLFLPYALLTIPFLPRFVVYIMRHVYLRAMFFIVC